MQKWPGSAANHFNHHRQFDFYSAAVQLLWCLTTASFVFFFLCFVQSLQQQSGKWKDLIISLPTLFLSIFIQCAEQSSPS